MSTEIDFSAGSNPDPHQQPMFWVARNQDEPMGPYSMDQIRLGIMRGQFSVDMQVRGVGDVQWSPLVEAIPTRNGRYVHSGRGISATVFWRAIPLILLFGMLLSWLDALMLHWIPVNGLTELFGIWLLTAMAAETMQVAGKQANLRNRWFYVIGSMVVAVWFWCFLWIWRSYFTQELWTTTPHSFFYLATHPSSLLDAVSVLSNMELSLFDVADPEDRLITIPPWAVRSLMVAEGVIIICGSAIVAIIKRDFPYCEESHLWAESKLLGHMWSPAVSYSELKEQLSAGNVEFLLFGGKHREDVRVEVTGYEVAKNPSFRLVDLTLVRISGPSSLDIFYDRWFCFGTNLKKGQTKESSKKIVSQLFVSPATYARLSEKCVASLAGGGGDDDAGEAGQTEFDVVLVAAGDKKIAVIKAMREATGLGLKEAKAVVDKAPCVVKKKISKDDAEALKARLEGVGASVNIKRGC